MSGGRWRNMVVAPARGVVEAVEARLEAQAGTELHVQALDGVISVNAYFTVAVFIGIAYWAGGPAVGGGGRTTCLVGAGPDTLARALLVLEVVAFACYLFSSLVAQGLKLLFLLFHHRHSQSTSHARLLRLGMLASALGTIAGTLFLTLSIVCLVELRLHLLSCASSSSPSSWPFAAIVPLVIMVSMGLLVFISAAIFSFLAG